MLSVSRKRRRRIEVMADSFSVFDEVISDDDDSPEVTVLTCKARVKNALLKADSRCHVTGRGPIMIKKQPRYIFWISIPRELEDLARELFTSITK